MFKSLRRSLIALPPLVPPRLQRHLSSTLPTRQATPAIRNQHPQLHFIRTMSATAPAKKEFLCIVPDKPGVLEKRLEVRGQHIETAKQLADEGSIALGGAMLTSHPQENEPPSFEGSALMVLAENEAEARKVLENDVYSKNGVWNLEKAKVIAFKSAVRVGL